MICSTSFYNLSAAAMLQASSTFNSLSVCPLACIDSIITLHRNLQDVDISPPTVEERLVQRLVVIEIDEGRKLLEGHVTVPVGIHFLHQKLQIFIAHLYRATTATGTCNMTEDSFRRLQGVVAVDAKAW